MDNVEVSGTDEVSRTTLGLARARQTLADHQTLGHTAAVPQAQRSVERWEQALAAAERVADDADTL
jgi:hypothetical protein